MISKPPKIFSSLDAMHRLHRLLFIRHWSYYKLYRMHSYATTPLGTFSFRFEWRRRPQSHTPCPSARYHFIIIRGRRRLRHGARVLFHSFPSQWSCSRLLYGLLLRRTLKHIVSRPNIRRATRASGKRPWVT